MNDHEHNNYNYMKLVHPKEDTLKFLCCYLNWKCVKKGGQEGETWRMLRVPDQGLGGQGHP